MRRSSSRGSALDALRVAEMAGVLEGDAELERVELGRAAGEQRLGDVLDGQRRDPRP